MNLTDLSRNWDMFGRNDPLWAILTDPAKKDNRWKEDEFFKTGNKEIKHMLSLVKSLGLKIGDGKALDFGCGVGRLTIALSEHFDETVGVDIAPSMIELARRYSAGNPKTRFVLNNEENLCIFKDEEFDFIYCRNVLQHMEPRFMLSYLSEFLRVLQNDGVLIFQIPSEKKNATISERVSKLIPKRLKDSLRPIQKEPIMELYCVKKDDVVKFVNDHGGKIADASQDSATGPEYISYRYCVTK